MLDYNKRLVEVDEVLNYLSEDDLEKIPKDIRQLIKDNKDKEYVWKYDKSKLLKNQNISRDTIVILSYLNMEYLLNPEQKKLIEGIHALNEKKQEEEKRKAYNPDNLFKGNASNENIEEQQETQVQSLVQYKEYFLTKIIKKIKNFFRK